MMDPEKKKRLEAAGWHATTVKEFLGLTDAEDEYVKMKVALSIALRDRRKKRKLGQVQVAKLMKSSQSRVAKMESADRSVSVDLMIWSLLSLGATNADIGRIIAQARPPA